MPTQHTNTLYQKKWNQWNRKKEIDTLRLEWKAEANELYQKKKKEWKEQADKEMKEAKVKWEKETKKKLKEMKKRVIANAYNIYQSQMNDREKKIRTEATRHQLNLINKQKIAIYYGYLTSNPEPLGVPMAIAVADPVVEPPPPPPVVVPMEERVEESKDDDPESTDYDTDDEEIVFPEEILFRRVVDVPRPTTANPNLVIPSDSDDDVVDLDGFEDDEPISSLVGITISNDRLQCSARCCSGTNQHTRRCVNPTTSMEKNHRREWVGVCKLHSRAIDTAMNKYEGWTRDMGHLYGWYDDRDTPQQRLRMAVVKKDYKGKPRKPKTKKTKRYRGQNRALRRN